MIRRLKLAALYSLCRDPALFIRGFGKWQASREGISAAFCREVWFYLIRSHWGVSLGAVEQVIHYATWNGQLLQRLKRTLIGVSCGISHCDLIVQITGLNWNALGATLSIWSLLPCNLHSAAVDEMVMIQHQWLEAMQRAEERGKWWCLQKGRWPAQGSLCVVANVLMRCHSQESADSIARPFRM